MYVPPPGSELDATITEHAANVGGDVKTVRYYKGNKALEVGPIYRFIYYLHYILFFSSGKLICSITHKFGKC